MGERVLLRTLTRKSVLPYGKFKGQEVGRVIDSRNKANLIWIYYNVQWISFVDEVLRELCINGDMVISKPGTCPEKFDDVMNIRMRTAARLQGDKNVEYRMYHYKQNRYKREVKKARKDEELSKGVMRDINHGHFGSQF